ncbi:DUF1134 domain-containing protein [Alsobacter sp. SYSU M60028]|uniref:DUF1134 domain-containing protein n=1 Tax=Alsobacter ponti TaxID=2962936 RepID=A0ABT1LJ55_9HYPH|nr:DUF1134 domain-containing protein [Alsobacter ponti]MCP8940928.1 DUF1134 domain-containing protein [Alsobacter ponti]
MGGTSTRKLVAAVLGVARSVVFLGALVGAGAALAQSAPPAGTGSQLPSRKAAQPPGAPEQFSSDELINSGHRFFGNVSRGLATAIEDATRKWGQPNGYILGQEGGAAFVGGLRYGEGKLYTRNAGDRRVFWQGPSVGFDFGGDGSRTMMLVYRLPSVDSIYQRFGGVDGSAYVIGGFSMTALVANDILLVPISSGVGARLGVSVGYLKFTPQSTWNPF